MYKAIPNRMKKMISVMLSILIVASMTIFLSEPKSVHAAGVTVDLSKLTESETGEGYSYDAASGVLTITSGPITLTSSGTIIRDKKVEVNGNKNNAEAIDIVLSGLIIDRTTVDILSDSPFCILKTNTSDVNITLVRANALLSNREKGTGLAKDDEESTLTIDGTGRLEASGNVGIGALYRSSASSVSNLVINGGTISATGRNGAGIGAGTGGRAKDLIINGGTINATSYYGCGIGTGNAWSNVTNYSGSNITINGGIIKASSNTLYGIGMGVTGSGLITINGGDIVVESEGRGSIGFEASTRYSTSSNAYININGGRIVSKKGYIGGWGVTITIAGGTIQSTALPLEYKGESLLVLGGSCCDLAYMYINILGYSNSSAPKNAFTDTLSMHEYSGYTPNELVEADQLYGMDDYDYNLHDIYADEEGKIYLWLPETVTATELATVTYQDGNNVVDSQLVILGGKTIESDVLSQDPDFLGWYDSSFTTKFDFSTPITGDLTLYAKRTNTTPSTSPTGDPTGGPTQKPTANPTTKPTGASSVSPTVKPTTRPVTPTVKPTVKPSGNPTSVPSGNPTTRPTTAPSANPTSAPSNNPAIRPTGAPSQSNQPGVADFVERLYTVALGRPSDPYGKADWINRVKNLGYTGADLAEGFLYSDEFLGKGLSDSEFLDVLYATFFNRASDQGGKTNWLNAMAAGMTKKQVIRGFIDSTEWANLCLSYGIMSGGTGVPNITIDASADIISFATRLYTTCLGRAADPNGLANWSSDLANMRISGSQAAHGFFFSEEFTIQNFSNDEYVTRLYRTFMGREPDPNGFADWVSRLNNGASREDVFQGFAGSAEWAKICSDYGILK